MLYNIFACKKINTTSHSVNHVYTLPLKLSSVIKKFGSGSIFCVFENRSMRFDRKLGYQIRIYICVYIYTH